MGGLRAWLVAAVSALLLGFAAAPAEARPLTQLAGPAGCIVAVVVPDCQTAAVGSPQSIVLAGSQAYVSSASDDQVRVYDRNATTGALTPRPVGLAGCIADDGAGTGCADARALDGPTRMALSPDGTRIYVVAANSGSVVVLTRDPATGNLTQSADPAACVNAAGASGCSISSVMTGVLSSLAVSGADVYVVGSGAAGFITLLDVVAGGLDQHPLASGGCATDTPIASCIDARAMSGASSVRLSTDGNNVYVTSTTSNAITAFARAGDGALTEIAGLNGCLQRTGGGAGCTETDLLGTQISPVAFTSPTRGYVGGISGGHITMVARDPATGALTAPGPCASDATAGPLAACADSPPLFGLVDLEPTPDGELIAGARFGRGMLAFTIAADGGPVPVAPPGGCLATGGIGQTTPCTLPRGFARVNTQDFGPADVAVSTDGSFAYGVSPAELEDRAGIVVAARPGGGSTTPPVVDKSAPTSTVNKIKCSKKHKCRIEVSAADTGGGTVVGLEALVKGKVKTADGDTKKVTKKPKAKPSGGGFEIKVKLKPGRYAIETTATDTSGNVQSPPAKKKFRVKA